MDLILITYLLFAQSSFLSARIDAGFERSILDLHNNFRSLYSRKLNVADMKMMAWDPKLARIARKLTRSCNVASSTSPLGMGRTTAGFGRYGVNTNTAPKGSLVWSMLSEWIQQYGYYSTEFHLCSPGHQCNDFMQMTASKNDRLGCSLITNCGSNQILTCVYSPGIRVGDMLHKTGSVCTKCDDSSPFCKNGLCDCKKTCSFGAQKMGILDRDICQCFCTNGFGPNCDEECKNPEQYLDYDICAYVTPEECSSPDHEAAQMLKEFCPEQCVCNRRSLTYDSK